MARIPQLYQPRAHSPVSPSSPMPGTPTTPTNPTPNPNPFASTETLGLPPAAPQRDSANLSNIGGLLLSGGWEDSPDHPQPKLKGRARSGTTAGPRPPIDHAALHARVKQIEHEDSIEGMETVTPSASASRRDSRGSRASRDSLDSDDSNWRTSTVSDGRPINASCIGVGLGQGGQNGQGGQQPRHDLADGPTQPLQPRNRTPQPQPQHDSNSPYGHHAQAQPHPAHPQAHRAAPRPPVVVNFPAPNIPSTPSPQWAPSPTSSAPPRGAPSPYGHPQAQPHQAHTPAQAPAQTAPRAKPPLTVQLPVTGGVVNPMLAAPPRAHFASPVERPQSPSIRGFDIMKEKAGTFREDETEVLNPFSPGARQAGPRRGPGGLSGLGRVSRAYSTVDFWKRFSTMGRVNQGGKDSGWMKERKRSVWSKPMFVVPLILTLLAVGAIVTYVVIKVRATPSVE